MPSWRFICIIAATIVISVAGLAQGPSPGSPAGMRDPNFQPPKLAPLPYDPMELVTGDAQQIKDTDQRAAALALLTTARSLSNVRARPYDLKTTFKSFGALPSDGTWTLEDISPSRNIYRWTAQGPSYSAIYLYMNRLLYSNQATGAMPLRLTQVRDAIFFIYPWTSHYTSVREALGYLHGVKLRCILIGQALGGRLFQGGRNWEESEYCVDPKSGLLATYSPVPGLYIQYDYTSAIHFHDEIIPEGFTISIAGQIIIEAKTQSVTDPAGRGNHIFDSSSLHALGVGSVLNPSWRVREGIYAPAPRGIGEEIGSVAPGAFVGESNPMPQDANVLLQVVVVHAVASPDGHITESEILASTNVSLNQAALDRVNAWKSRMAGPDVQPGTTPQWREVIFTREGANPPT